MTSSSSTPAMTTPTYVYLRISEDREANLRSIDNQRSDVVALISRLGQTVTAEFVDNDISAYGTKARPGYQALAEAVAAGPCTVAVWAVDRLYRRPRELEALLDLVEKHAVRIETVRGGSIDLNSHEGRLQARILVSLASFESGHRSDRIRLAARRSAERGDWHGGRKFGYQLVGDGSAVLDPVEAPIIREIADRFLAGESIRSITTWVNTLGIPTLRGSVCWHTNSVRQLLASARIAGLRAYEPKDGGPPTIFRSTIGPGRWPAIISPTEREQIHAVLKNPERRISRAGQNLLTGIATCGKCGAGLLIASTPATATYAGRKRYICKPLSGRPERGGVSVTQAPLEHAITEAVIRRLAVTAAPPRPGSEPAPLWAAVSSARQMLENLAVMFAAGDLERGEYRAAREAARGRLETAERALSQRSRPGALLTMPLGDEAALRERWAELSIGQRQAILRALIDTLVIKPAARPSRHLDLERIELRWRV